MAGAGCGGLCQSLAEGLQRTTVNQAHMKIAILSRNPQLYSTRRLVNGARRRGHSVSVIDPLRCYMNITPTTPEIHYRGKPLTGFDAVIPRIGTSVTYYGLAVLRQFEAMGVVVLNSSTAVARSRDKLLA